MSNPNILFLMTDQQRWDAMGASGGWVTTPALDRIAAEGVRFTQCITTTPICIPARVTLATGRYPHNNAVWNNLNYTLPTDAPDKAACEALLRDGLRRALDELDGDLPIMFKLTLPEAANYYREFCEHPRVLRVVALSGGYSREVANAKLAANDGVIASFSRALTEGLRADMDDAEFASALDASVASIAAASRA
jgi:hypothetical protein